MVREEKLTCMTGVIYKYASQKTELILVRLC